MKFYYNGKLIRTSRTHEYNFAAISPTGKCLTCSATYEGCAKNLATLTANGRGWLSAYEAIYYGTFKETKGGWTIKDIMGRFNNSREELKEAIEKKKAYFDGIKIVKLEARA